MLFVVGEIRGKPSGQGDVGRGMACWVLAVYTRVTCSSWGEEVGTQTWRMRWWQIEKTWANVLLRDQGVPEAAQIQSYPPSLEGHGQQTCRSTSPDPHYLS